MCDPRYKLEIFDFIWKNDPQKEANVNRAKRHFESVYRQYKERADNIRAFQVINDEPEEVEEEAVDKDDPFYGFETHVAGAIHRDRRSEVQRWWEDPRIHVSASEKEVQAFWQAKGYDFKIIAQMARDHMAIPGTSAASERVFSSGGDILTKKRNKLTGEHVRHLLCLRSWGVYVEADDFEFMKEDDAVDVEAEVEAHPQGGKGKEPVVPR